jgi:hypothetical protein
MKSDPSGAKILLAAKSADNTAIGGPAEGE